MPGERKEEKGRVQLQQPARESMTGNMKPALLREKRQVKRSTGPMGWEWKHD